MPQQKEQEKLNRERYRLLNQLQHILEMPMVVLGFTWLVLLIIELTRGLNPFLQTVSAIIWVLFILDFIVRFILAPAKVKFLKNNIITLISLVVPALRLFRIFRAFRILQSLRATRSLRLVKVIGSINRGMRSLSATMQRRAFGYVLLLTLLVMFIGAAGILAFEKEANEALNTYGEALWWTAMLFTSIGSEAWPKTPEGRTLCVILSLYGFAVFGYFTAALASVFIGQDAGNKRSDVAGAKQITALHEQITALRQEIKELTARK